MQVRSTAVAGREGPVNRQPWRRWNLAVRRSWFELAEAGAPGCLVALKSAHEPASSNGELLFVACDDRGRELEVVAVALEDGDLLVIRVMPTGF